MASLNELLMPQVVVDVISRIRMGQGRVSRLLGMNLKGKNIREVPGRYAAYRIFDKSRTSAMGRAPGTGPATIPVNPIGQVSFQMARFHEKIILDYEMLGHLSPLAGPNAQVDKGGQDYLTHQETYLAERINTAIEILCAGLLRGSIYLKLSGDNWTPYLSSPSGASVQVNYQVPAGNLSQLNMLGTGNAISATWANASTTILKDLMTIKTYMAQLHGWPLRDVLINSTTWYYLVTNTEIRNVGGNVYQPFETYEQVAEKDADGQETNAYYAVLRADPTIRWHIIDDVVAIDGTDPSYSGGTATLTKVIPDNVAVFLPNLDEFSQIAKMYHGSEYVVEYPNLNAPVERKGYYAWTKYVDQPSGVEIIDVLNCLPALFVPKGIAFGTVVF